ncbi:MAG TPA: P-loop NTPase, partial [Actinomycetota bacterium]|nr:P-loop NTPase [Actinomycetota bacterium]
MIQQQVIAVGTPQTFRAALARSLEVELDAVGWVQSVTAAEEILVDTDNSAHVLVLSPEVKEPDALGLAEFVGRAAPMTAIIVVRDKSWNGLLPAAMRAGIRDVVDLTKGSEELRDAVERAILWAENISNVRGQSAARPKHRGSIISVFASKGGVGKTFLTTNLAAALADISKQETAVADLDVDMGDVFSYFGREPVKQMTDLIALGEGADREAVFANGTKLYEHLWGFGAVPDPSVTPPSGESIGKFLRVLRNNFAFVVVDASADYTDLALACFDLSDAICLVTALDVVGVKHLSRALETLLTIGLPRDRFRIILNRADSRVGLDTQDVERVMKLQVDTMIPSSRLVPTCLNKGRPVVLEEPGSEV